MSVYKPAGYEIYLIKLRVGKQQERFPGLNQETPTRSIERYLKKLIAVRAAHDPIPTDLAQWLIDLPQRLPALYEKLCDFGLLSRATTDARRPLMELLYGVIKPKKGFEERVTAYHRNGNSPENARRKAMALHTDLYDIEFNGWFQNLLAKGNTVNHVLLQTARARVAIEGCSFKHYRDLHADRLASWLAQQRKTNSKRFGHSTSNYHLKAMRSFAKWARDTLKWFHEPNPFEGMKLLNEKEDIRRRRRPATEAETRKLLKATRTGPAFKGISGKDRAMLYRVALVEALRASECYSLTPESFRISDDEATVTVQASYSKHRREDVLPLPDYLARLLKPWLKNKPTGKPLWPGSWVENPAEMLRADLDRAKIPYHTDRGYLDFHAQRHTAITNGADCMPVHHLQKFARHGKIETTLRYTHTTEEDLAGSVAKLVPLPETSARRGVQTPEHLPSPDHKPDHDSDQTVAHGKNRQSSVVTRKGHPGNAKTPEESGVLSPVVTGIHQRARRGSNPQPPDRQSGTLTN